MSAANRIGWRSAAVLGSSRDRRRATPASRVMCNIEVPMHTNMVHAAVPTVIAILSFAAQKPRHQ